MAMVAEVSGTFKLGGELEIHRLGYGAMRLTGKGIWGEPEDRERREAGAAAGGGAGRGFHRYGGQLWPGGERAADRRGAGAV